MGSKAEGGRKISGEEKNLANAQAGYLNTAGSNLSQLQALLTSLGPQQLATLGINSAGQALQPGQYPTAPTAVADPGARPADYRSTFQGKSWGKNDQAKQDASLAAQQQWDTKNAAYQQYQQQTAAYQQQVAQINANPDAYYLQDPVAGQQREDAMMNSILQGKATSDGWAAQGSEGAVAGTRASLLQQFQKYASGQDQDTAASKQALDQYQQRLGGNFAERGTLDTLLGQYNQQLAGNIPEAGQMQGFLDRLSRGIAGDTYVNPQLQHEMDLADQAQRTSLFSQLGSGYANSSAGIEALQAQQRSRLGTIDQLNQQDIQSALSGYLGLSSSAQDRQNNTYNQYTGLSQTVDSQTQNLLNQYLGLQGNYRSNLGAFGSGYTGLTDFSAQQRQNNYANQFNNRLQQVGAAGSIAAAPYQVDYNSLINAYTGALNSSTNRQTGPATSGGGWQQALGQIGGTLAGGAAGYAIGGPMGTFKGASLGGSLGGSAGYSLYN